MNSNNAVKAHAPARFALELDWKTVLWIALFIFIVFTRFHHLGDKPFHHDESLYAKYIWNFHTGLGYKYDPMQHGPFLFHMQQIPLFLFGVTNYTIRILPAMTGFFLTLGLFLMRRRLSAGVALLAGWIFAINPVFMYFQRFLRHDPFFSLFSILILLFMILWFQDRKPWQFYSLMASISVLFCIKENAFVNILILFTFVCLKVVAEMAEKEDGKFLGLKSITRNMNEFPLISKLMMMISIWGVTFVIYAAGNQWMKSRFSNWDKTVSYYWYICFLVYVVYIVGLVWMGEKARSNQMTNGFMGLKPEFFKDSHVFAIGMLIFSGIFILLYTTFFTNTANGFWGGIYKWYTYWLHQHEIARIRGPFHYYHHQMLIYAFIPLSVAFIGLIARTMRKAGYLVSSIYLVLFISAVFVATSSKSAWPFTKQDLFTNDHLTFAIGFLIAGLYCTYTYIREKDFLKALLSWWSLLAYLIYSYLQEKVPWLTMHIITPMIILAAIYLVEIFRNQNKRVSRNVMICFFSIMVVYSLHTSFMLNWHHEADPTEQMVYVQTTDDIPELIHELEDMCFWLHEDKGVPVLIDGHATWPLYWYLRDWKNISYGKHVDTNRHLVVICNWEDRQSFKEKVGDGYTAHRLSLRAWYIPTRKDLATGNTFRNAWRWVLLRERFKPTLYGSQDICVFVRNDMAKYNKGVEIEAAKEPEPKRREPPKTGSVMKRNDLEFGRFGTAEGQFNEPKDIEATGEFIYVCDSNNNRIQQFDLSGKIIKAWGKQGQEAGQFDKPRGLGIDSHGNVFIADTWNHRIQKFDKNGKFLMQFGDGSIFWAPKDVAVDDEGFIYVVNTGFHRIQKFNRNGTQVWSVGSKGKDKNQFTEPVGIVIDKLNRVYVADTGNKKIAVYDRDGHFLKEIATFGWDDFYTEPFIALDEANNLLLATDSRSNRIEVFDMDGKFKTFWGRDGNGNGQFKFPIGIAVANEQIYVSDSMNHRVQAFDTGGF